MFFGTSICWKSLRYALRMIFVREEKKIVFASARS